jgi:hypothetical protein
MNEGAIALEKISVGGRPLQTTVDPDKRAMIFERCMELIMQVQSRVFDSLQPQKIVSLFKLGDGTPPKLGMTTGEIVSGFYSFLGFTRLTSEKVVAKAVATGVEKKLFGYTGDAPTLGTDGKYQVSLTKVRTDALAEDEIDLESGFIMLPQAIPQPAPVTPPGGVPPVTPPGQTPAVTPPGTTPPPPGVQPSTTPAAQTEVELSFTADRSQLYSAWNAIQNLADLAGKVSVTVKAEKADGLDKAKLQNGVIEPLREADLIE